MEPLQPNQIFAGRYQIERPLAQGGMGAVFVARHLSTEQQVALKVLWPQLLGSPELIESFKLEAKVAARLDCEHVVQVLDAGFESGMPFLVMELLRGETLAATIQRAGAMPAGEVARVLRQVAVALDKAHGYADRDGNPSPIIHRDLKPENIFLCRRPGAEDSVKVLDFGIAKVLSAATLVSADIKGTPAFMAHEQAIAARVSPQTDIWPLALIAFQALTGRHFWRTLAAPDGATVAAILLDLVSHPSYTPSQRTAEMGLPALPSGFDSWFEVCTRRDPAARYQRASEAIEALSALLQGQPFAAPAASPALQPAGQPTLQAALPGELPPLSLADTHAAPAAAAPAPAPAATAPALAATAAPAPAATAAPASPRAVSPQETLPPSIPLQPRRLALPLGLAALGILAALGFAARSPAQEAPQATPTAAPSATPQPAVDARAAEPPASSAAAPSSAAPDASGSPPASARPAGKGAPAQATPRPPTRPTRPDVYGDR